MLDNARNTAAALETREGQMIFRVMVVLVSALVLYCNPCGNHRDHLLESVRHLLSRTRALAAK